MADQDTTASANPFDQIEPDEPKKPVNPFDSGLPDLAEGTSRTGSFLHAAARSLIPTVGSFPAIAAGAELGAAAGALTGPAAPIAAPVLGLVGGLAGGFLGGAAISHVQDWALSKLPDSWTEAIGQDERTRRLEEQQHGTAAFLGALLPFALTMRPGAIPKGNLPENATALQRIMAHPVTSRLFGGAVMGGIELGQEVAQGESPNWTHVAVSTGAGIVFNRPTRLGERLNEMGARPTRRLLGRPEPTEAAPEQPPAPETAPTAPIEQTLRRGDPTVAQAADAKVMGPGVTESVFMGSHEQSPSSALTAQEIARAEQMAHGELPPHDIHAVARQMHPELFEARDALMGRRETFRAWLSEAQAEGLDAPAAREHLAAVDAEISEIGPQIAAAYRRAADATSSHIIEPATVSRETQETGPIKPVPIDQQKAAIAADVAARLTAAGRPPEEARLAGQLVASRYEARAAAFNGALGTAEQLYRREGAIIRGPREGPTPAAAPKVPEAVAQYLTPMDVSEIEAMIARKADPAEIRNHPAIERARRDYDMRPQTVNRPDFGTPRYEANREFNFKGNKVVGYEAGVRRLIDHAKAYAQGRVEYGKRAILVMGPPASGKSTIAVRLAEATRSAIVDADDAKFVLPEYDNGRGAHAVHEESSYLANQKVLPPLMVDGANLILPIVGANPVSIRQRVAMLREAGYQVDLVHMQVDEKEAYRRMIRRFLKDGRLIGSDYFEFVDNKPGRTYLQIKGEGNVREALEIDGNGPVGSLVAIDGGHTSLARHLRLGGGGGQAPTGGHGTGPAGIAEAESVAPPARPIASEVKNGVVTFAPNELAVDANRFQFKEGGDAYGVSERLSGVKHWDPIKAGMVLAWEDNSGRRFIVDGHQRLGLAKRIAAEDPSQQPRLNGYLLREADGVTDTEARAIAASKNIAEGTGTAIDAAKILRDRPDLMKELPPRSELVRQARDLVNLEPEPFRVVINGLVEPHQAALVGRLAPRDARMQIALLDLLHKTDPENLSQAEAIVRQGIAAGTHTETQMGLFGEEEIVKSLFLERAKVLDRALREIRRDRTIFNTLVKEREAIEATGSQLAHDVNEQRAQADAAALQILQTLANRTGPVADALNAAARRVKRDGKYAPAVRDVVDAIRREAQSGNLARLADGAGGGLADVGKQGEPSPGNTAPIAGPEAAADADKVLELFQRKRDIIGEREAQGQMALPGTERISLAELAQRKANAPLLPSVEQRSLEIGLFGETAPQGNLFEAVHGRNGQAVRERAPRVPRAEPAGGAEANAPVRRPEQISLLDWGAGERDVRRDHERLPSEQGGAGDAVPRPGESVTKPPQGSRGIGAARSDQPGARRRIRGIKEADEKIAERSRSNYRITPEDHVGEGTPKAKVRANLDAIRILKTIEEENRQATPEEKKTLVKYTGWGAHAQSMFLDRDNQWRGERRELRALLSDEEYEAARASTPNAHFTSPEVIDGMWKALDYLGYDGGLAIEPAAGIGHFIGLIPDRVAPKTAWTAVELDTTSARITKALYGGTEVNAHGFEELKRPSNYYDLAISNVPFGDYNLREQPYGAFPIHDFFFVKSLDKVRPGGMVAFITSRYTMDRLDPGTRKLLGKTADLVAAVRLPGGKKGAFAGNAGTEVTTDILFLRKKIPGERPFTDKSGKEVPWFETKEISTPEGPVQVNEYFADHPEMMLGDMRLTGTMYGGKLEPVLEGSTDNLAQRIREAIAANATPSFTKRAEPATVIPADEIAQGVKDGAFFVKDGALYRREAGTGVAADLSKKDEARVTALVGMRDTVNDLLGAQLKGTGDPEALRRKLRRAYDKFVEEHGPINLEERRESTRNGKTTTTIRLPNMLAFRRDPDAWKVAAIENYDYETGKVSRAQIQEKDVIDVKGPREINGPSDALAASLDDTNGIDLDHIANSLGLNTYEEAIGAMGDLIYQNPNGRKWETADNYLSGNVVQKLEEARAIAATEPAYLRNVTALEKVQPTPLHSTDITAQLGAPWIPDAVYKEFLESVGGSSVEVRKVPGSAEFRVRVGGENADARAKYATDRVSLDDVADAAINNRQLTVWDTDAQGKRTVNDAATEEARTRVNLLKEAFAGDPERGIDGWVWEDAARSEILEGIYNRTFNNLVARQFDGSHLTLPGMNPDFTGRQHRKDAIWRMVQYGNTLLAHAVGSGKTATMIGGGMEMKRLGLINKPAYVVPNHMLEQFSRDFTQIYPNAKILVASKDEVSAEHRKAFIAKVAANDWDGIVITHRAFSRINIDKEFRVNFVREQMDELSRMITEEKGEAGKNAPTVKQLEKSKKRLQAKLQELMAEEKKDPGTSFEETGIDHLFVDEAHRFKNLSFLTRLARIPGLAQGDAQRAEDLFLKIRYLEQKRPGRSAVFATGTPVSNTMAELWTMMRYLAYDKLKERGLDTFDAWAQTFGRVVTNMELSADGRTYQERASFSKFVNIPELISLYGEIADTKTADMLKLPRPEVRTRSGAPGIEIVKATPSAQEEAHIESLVKLAESLKGKRVKKGEPNMLSVVTAGRKVATDGRLIGPDFEFNPNGKVAKATDNIARIYHEGKEPGMVQMVFLDMGTPKSKGPAKPKPDALIQKMLDEDSDLMLVDTPSTEDRINLYDDIKQRLIEKGVPADEIAFIHDAPTEDKKKRLSNEVRRGTIRVLIGSTEKMGEGLNVQPRLIAMHHLDAPWKPAWVEQRDGRIVRQGNLNPFVQIYRYVTEHSFDAFMWQKLDTKSKFIGQVLSGAKGSRHAEDIDNPLPEAAEMKAAASGDPRILEHAELDRQVRMLSAQRRAFQQTRERAQWQVGTTAERIRQYEEALPTADADASRVIDLAGDKFQVVIGNKALTSREDAGKEILARLSGLDLQRAYSPKVINVGTLSGFEMNMEVRSTWSGDGPMIKAELSLKGKSGYGAVNDIVINEETPPAGLIRRFENILPQIKGRPEQLRRSLEDERKTAASLQKTLETPWVKAEEYKTAVAKLDALTKGLKQPTHPEVTAEANRPAEDHTDELHQRPFEYYEQAAERNLQATSRTAKGSVDVSSSAEKAKSMAATENVADRAGENFRKTLAHVWEQRDQLPKTTEGMVAFIDDVASRINQGIVKEGHLDRTHETKFKQTPVAELPEAKRQFAEELVQRLGSGEDPVTTAAWIEWRANIIDHFWSDGVGRTSKALAAAVLMRANEPLPNYPSNREFFKFAPKDEVLRGAAITGPEFERFNEFYHGLVEPELEQGVRGGIRLNPNKVPGRDFLGVENTRPIMRLARDANASTFIHESGHQYLAELMRDAQHPQAPDQIKTDADTILDWFGVKNASEIKTSHHERFARGFEQYLREGVAPSPELMGVFEKFKQWLVQIYQTLRGLGEPINDNVREVFERMLAAEPQRTVVAPERPQRPTIHDIHESDAATTEAHEAEAGADRINAERLRSIEEAPPEVQHEIQTAEAEQQAAAGGGAEPGAEAPGGGRGLPEMERVGAPPGPEPAGGGVRPQPGEERAGGAAVTAESATADYAREQRERDAELPGPQQLAPQPARIFGAKESPYTDRAGNIRIENLTTKEDVAQAIRDAAAENDEFIGDRRGVVTDGQVMDLAEAIGMTPEQLARRKVGEAFNAEQVVAARKLLIESATNVATAAKKAANGTDEDVMAYAMAKDRHQMIQGQVAGITAEAGRALRAFRNITGMSAEAQQMDMFVRQATGKTLYQLKSEAALAAELQTPQQMSKFMIDAQKKTFGRMVLEYWINGLLSSPSTHMTNFLGNTILTVQHFALEQPVAAAIGAARASMGREGPRVHFGEIGAAAKAAVRSLPSALQATGHGLMTAERVLLPGEKEAELPFLHTGPAGHGPQKVLDETARMADVLGNLYGTVQGLRDGIVATAKLVAAGGDAGAPVIGTRYSLQGAIPDIAIRGVNVLPVGTMVRMPGRFLSAADGFSRAANYAMAKHSIAYRMATEEGLSGAAFDRRVAELVANPSEQMMEAARVTATELTLMTKGGPFMQAINHLANVEVMGTPIFRFVMPFVNIAGQIANQAIVKRTPVGLLSKELRADLSGANGNIAQDTAMARMLVGTAITVAFGTLAAQGLASGSGPTDRTEALMWRLAGNQAHSVRIGDTWYDITKLGPLGMMLGISADMWDVAKDAGDEEYTTAAAHVVHAITQNILDQSFMKGPADLIQALEDSDRYGDQYVRNMLSSFMPMSVGMGAAARAQDPYMRHARTVVDALKAKVPGLSQELFAKRDIWGEPMPNREALIGRGLTGIYLSHVSRDPVNIAMMQLGIYPAPVQRKIRNVDLDDQQYDDYARLSGRMTKQRLDAMVRSPDWQTWPNHIRQTVINEVIRQSREAARGLIMMKYPSIPRDAVQAKRDAMQD